MENSVTIPPKIKNRTIIEHSNSTSGYLSEENENTNFKRYVYPSPTFIAALYTIAKIWKNTRYPPIDD